MKALVLLPLIIFFVCKSSAQKFSGTVKDIESKAILKDVSVRVGSQKTFSDTQGYFELRDIKPGDTIIFSQVGYQRLDRIIYDINKKNSYFMKTNSILLEEVIINSPRSYFLDSLHLRKEFAKTFSDTTPKFKDIFVTKSFSNSPKSPFLAANSTASIVTIDVLSVISFIRKNRSSQVKLQKILQKEEEERHIDKYFSKQKIQHLTKLQGDSLQTFINLYRPDSQKANNMTEYDFILYVKNCYQDYMAKDDLKIIN